MITFTSVIKKRTDVLVSGINNDIIVMDMTKGIYVSLNKIAGTIWGLLDTVSTPQEIINALMLRYQVDEETCMHETFALLNKLHQEKMIAVY